MLYKRGSKDKQVGIIQDYLNRIREEVLRARDPKYKVSGNWEHLDVDNDFGIKTENAVRGFQKMLEITENGIVGNTTWNYLSTFSLGPVLRAQQTFRGYLKIGDKGPDVREVQELLNKAWTGVSPETRSYYKWEFIAVDGVFGIRTKEAVMAFQNFRGLKPVSGEVGNTTYDHLKSNYQRVELLRGDYSHPNVYVSELTKALKIAIASFPQAALDWLIDEKRKDPKIGDIIKVGLRGQTFDELSKKFYLYLLNFMKGGNPKLEEAARDINNWKVHTGNGKTPSYVDYDKHVDVILDKSFKSYKNTRLTPEKILNNLQFREGFATAGRWVGRIATWYQVAISFVPLIQDLSESDRSKKWQNKWNKHFGDFVVNIISIIGATIVGIIASYVGAPFLLATIICMAVVGAINYVFSLLRKTTWGAKVEERYGNMAYMAVKRFQEWSFDEYKKGSPIFTPGFSGPFR